MLIDINNHHITNIITKKRGERIASFLLIVGGKSDGSKGIKY